MRVEALAGFGVILLVAVGAATWSISAAPRAASSPSKIENLVRAGMSRLRSQDFSGAAALFGIDPKDWTLWNERGKARAGLADYSGALRDFDEAVVLNPASAELHNNRGGAKLGLGDRSGAIENFSKAVAVNPGYAAPRLNRAQARAELGDWAGAVADYENGLALLGPSDRLRQVVLQRLRSAKERQGQPAAANYY
jgi:tetratricopeptide (TPR) repeat protein